MLNQNDLEPDLFQELVHNIQSYLMPHSKKGSQKDTQSEPTPNQPLQYDLFKLQYLHNSINYILHTDNDLTHTLKLDQQLLNELVAKNPSNLGLNFIEQVKAMKVRSPFDYSKDMQDYGEFINHHLSRSKKHELSSVEKQLQSQVQLRREVKRLRKTFPNINLEAANYAEVKSYQERQREMILSQATDCFQGLPEAYDESCERNELYREMFPKEFGREVAKPRKLLFEEHEHREDRAPVKHEQKRKHIAKAHKKDEAYYSASYGSKRKREEDGEEKEVKGVAAHCRSKDHISPSKEKGKTETQVIVAEKSVQNYQVKGQGAQKIKKPQIVPPVNQKNGSRSTEFGRLGERVPQQKKKGKQQPPPLKLNRPFKTTSLKKGVSIGCQQPEQRLEKAREKPQPAKEPKFDVEMQEEGQGVEEERVESGQRQIPFESNNPNIDDFRMQVERQDDEDYLFFENHSPNMNNEIDSNDFLQ